MRAQLLCATVGVWLFGALLFADQKPAHTPQATHETIRLQLKPVKLKSRLLKGLPDSLVKPNVISLSEDAAAQRLLKMHSGARVGEMSLNGYLVTIGVELQNGLFHYTVLPEGGTAVNAIGKAPEERGYTELTLQVPGLTSPLTIAVRATGNPATFVRMIVPVCYEAHWTIPDGPTVQLALYDPDHTGRFPLAQDALLLSDLNGNGHYETYPKFFEVLKLDIPIRFQGVNYAVSTNPTTQELLLTPTGISGRQVSVLQAGKPAPYFHAEDLSGTTVSLTNYRGKFLFVEVWGSGSGPYLAGVAGFQELAKQGGDAVHVVGISVDEKKAAAQAFWQSEKPPYQQLWTPGGLKGDFCRAYKVGETPSTFVIDPDGILLDMNLTGDDMAEALRHTAGYPSEQSKRWLSAMREWNQFCNEVNRLQSEGEFSAAVALLQKARPRYQDPKRKDQILHWIAWLEQDDWQPE